VANTLMTELPRIQSVGSFYDIEEDERVLNFLNQNPRLTPFLIEAYTQIERYFGADQAVSLQLVSDPEIEGFDELFAYIVTRLPIDEAYNNFSQFRDQWFLNHVVEVNYLLNFSLQLR
jgi:hypothetical protein